MPISIMGSAIIFNIINTFIQGEWLFHLSPLTMYANEWLKDPRFISGLCIFAAGYYINKQSDNILRNLRKPGETGYKIPEGGMYRFISCPNYFGELLEWIGWAFMTWSPAGIFFVIWTAANLLPRARSNHKWYLEKFPSYPTERKAVIPFVF
jgi:protein-S-isoprenylcysteine O-methyltransferase Ste14